MILANTFENRANLATLVRSGGVAILPAGTVMGLFALPGFAGKITELKGRDEGKRFLLNAADLDMARAIAPVSKKEALLLANPLITVVLANGTGVRIPDDKALVEIIRAVGESLISSSCNKAGEAPALTAVAAEAIFPDVPVLEESCVLAGAPSAIVKVERGEVIVLRPGAATV